MIKRLRTTHALALAPCVSWRVWLIVCCMMLLLLLVLVALAPVLLSRHQTFQAAFIYRPLSYICHQIPERSFQLVGHPLPICARCLGLYAGFFVGALILPFLRPFSTKRALAVPARHWFILALIPTAFDFGLDVLGWRQNTHASRVLTGLLLGAVSAFYVLPGLIELCYLGVKSRAAESSVD
ncbi:MAG: DUF2085 domain-containing protein [Pyrinomonadaceae bacterium]